MALEPRMSVGLRAAGPLIPPQPATASRRQPGLPVPPQPVMPPEGIGPVTDPTADAGGDAQSPTTMVLNYLKQRGYQPSSENVRRALEANQRDPGVIPGLRSDRPATDAEDMAAMRAAGVGGAGGGARPLPVPPIPPSGGAPNTSAAPSTGGTTDTGAMGGSGIGPLGMSIAAGIPAAALMYGASRIPARPGDTPSVGASVPPPVDPGAGAPRLGGPEVPPLLPPSAANEVSPMETAMRRAVNDPSAVEGVRPVDPGIATMPPRGPVDMPPIPFNSPQPRVAPPPVDPAVIRTSPNLRVTPRPRLNLRF